MGNYLLISDAAKEVKVESHVLRYWEEELHLPIKRNELGHRYYTEADVERFRQIKSMKERGLQLKAIKMILKDGRLEVLPGEKEHGDDRELSGDAKMKEDAAAKTESMPALAIDIVERVPAFDASKVEANDFREESQNSQQVGAVNAVEQDAGALQESKEERTRKLQWVLQEMIREAVRDNNDLLCREIKESVIKELDYQFRMQEERDEAREQRLVERDESYYKKMDELLRKKTRMRKESEDMGTKKNVEQKKSVTEYESAKKATSLWKRKKIEKALP